MNKSMTNDPWAETNHKAILQRLELLNRQPDGYIYSKRTNLNNIVIHKVKSQIHLVYLDPTASEIMSRIDIANPLNLLALYTQAMMLGLAWKPEPKRVYMIGFSGGRIPLVLHHYFPALMIESTDIEPWVVEIATKFFGIKFDPRLKISIEDGRDYLAHLKQGTFYDFIMMDGYRGNGYGPYRLSTIEFYNLCKQHLVEGGVVTANILVGDSLYADKILTFSRAFAHTYFFRQETADVLIGTDGPDLSRSELIGRIKQVQEKHRFPFSLAERASYVTSYDEWVKEIPAINQARVLTDANPPPGYFESLSPLSTVFAKAGRNDPCPCGSGKKFKLCHGPQFDKLPADFVQIKKESLCPCGS
jgi:spermidine synthase